MRITNENVAVNSSKSISASAIGANKSDRQSIAEDNYNIARFDRYEGVSACTATFDLNAPAHIGIFSDNTSDEVVKKILKWQEEKDGCAPEGFSAKHIVSAFFQAESEERYNCGVNYEHAADNECGWSYQDTIGSEVCNGKFTEDNVALIASQVGKYIDHCHETGKFSDEEYAQLNDEMKKCSKHWLDMITVAKVGKRLREEDAKLYGSRFYVEMPVKTRQERLLEELSMRRRIEAENPFDINAFFAKVEQMRFNVTGIKSNFDKSDSAKANTGSKS